MIPRDLATAVASAPFTTYGLANAHWRGPAYMRDLAVDGLGGDQVTQLGISYFDTAASEPQRGLLVSTLRQDPRTDRYSLDHHAANFVLRFFDDAARQAFFESRVMEPLLDRAAFSSWASVTVPLARGAVEAEVVRHAEWPLELLEVPTRDRALLAVAGWRVAVVPYAGLVEPLDEAFAASFVPGE